MSDSIKDKYELRVEFVRSKYGGGTNVFIDDKQVGRLRNFSMVSTPDGGEVIVMEQVVVAENRAELKTVGATFCNGILVAKHGDMLYPDGSRIT